jgi:hypothetical protein
VRFDLNKLNDAEVKEQYQVKIPTRFAVLENVIMCTTIGLGKELGRI